MTATGNSMPIELRRRQKAERFDHGEPLSRASSLPMAILFTVLGLVILSQWRPPDHALLIDLPVSSGLGRPFTPWPQDLPAHQLRLTELNEIWWDNDVMNQGMLAERLQDLVALQEGLIFRPDGNASYNEVAKTLNIIVASGVAHDRLCLAGMADHRQFNRGSSPGLMITIEMPVGEQPPFYQRAAPEGCDLASSGPAHTHVRP
jgi:biopolymer transport protein ExbD